MSVNPPVDRLTAVLTESLSRYSLFFYWDPSAVDQLRESLAEHLLADLAPAAAAVAAPPPATRADDQAALRDRIAERPERYAVAIHDAMESDLSLVDQEPGQQALFARAAEAVMALADSEQATLRRKLAAAEKIRENADFHLGQEMARRQLAEKEAARLSADQAAVLNAAAQHLYTALFPAVYDDMGQKAAEGVQRAVSELRRLAVEAQQQPDPGTCGHRSPEGHLCGRDPGHYGYHRHVALEGGWYSWLGELAEPAAETPEAPPREPHPTEADLRHAQAVLDRFEGRDTDEPAAGARQDGAQPYTPPAHYRRDDGVECCVHTIPVGPDSCRECRDLADDDRPTAGPSVVDEVVAALQAKAQALSVEAEAEMRRDLEEQAQVWHEAANLARRTGRKAARTTQPAAGARQDGAQPQEVCGKTRSVDGTEYRPCALSPGHPEAYCQSADGMHLFLAPGMGDPQ